MVAVAPDVTDPCTNHTTGMHKRGYRTSTQAKRAIKFAQTREGGRAMVAYHAPCGLWHIGHRPKART